MTIPLAVPSIHMRARARPAMAEGIGVLTIDDAFVYVLKRLHPDRSGSTMVAGVFTTEAMGRRVFDTLPLELQRRAMLVRVPLPPRTDGDG
ncbi:hypothetical protein [Naasia aerilata]|uniref:hypothetical protein n=1 Tax=Naasia aerilata TaxID=1162966 RepID=UPI002574611E|nr:hypothetical protein [Naasia aerilata]